MIYVGIDVAKDKHDCYVSDSDGVELYAPFIIQNTREGFEDLFEKVRAVAPDLSKVKIGLEATTYLVTCSKRNSAYSSSIRFTRICSEKV